MASLLTIQGPNKGQRFPLDRDATVIGRQDPVTGHFPDIDVGDWLDAASARKVSREHALVLRSRATGTFALRPLMTRGCRLLQKLKSRLPCVKLASAFRLRRSFSLVLSPVL